MQFICGGHTKTKTHACLHVKHVTVLYLHYPLKHVSQREERDEHIFTVGFQCALGDDIHGKGRGRGRGRGRIQEDDRQARWTGRDKRGHRGPT